jgi:hypothetical protein
MGVLVVAWIAVVLPPDSRDRPGLPKRLHASG